MDNGVIPGSTLKSSSSTSKFNNNISSGNLVPEAKEATMAQANFVDLTFPLHGLSAGCAKKAVDADLVQDSEPQNNLASFVCTEMEPEAEMILMDGMRKNFIDLDQYKGSGVIQEKCVAMIADLWNAPEGATPCGTSTLGSSEAIMLAGLAMRAKWRKWCEETGRSMVVEVEETVEESELSHEDDSEISHEESDSTNAEEKSKNNGIIGVRKVVKKTKTILRRPNIVCGSNVQVCWHKMCKYFDIDCREADVSAESLVLTAERAAPLIDENTIGVCPILGSTFNGEYEDIKGIHDMVVALNEENGWQVPIHVDAASGGFIAPFLNPQLEWDFRLPMVKSINASGHKFGLTYAGLGWIMFREEEDLPQDLVFSVGYLGGSQSSFTLNFSKSASTVLAQYYNFVRHGFEGYKQIMEDCMDVAGYLRKKIVNLSINDLEPRLTIVDKAHMPLVSWSLTEKQMERCSVFELQERLEKRGGWSVPAYSCSKGAEDLKIMRVVVKNSFSMVLCDLLLKDIEEAFAYFDTRYENATALPTINEDLSLKAACLDSKTGIDGLFAEHQYLSAETLSGLKKPAVGLKKALVVEQSSMVATTLATPTMTTQEESEDTVTTVTENNARLVRQLELICLFLSRQMGAFLCVVSSLFLVLSQLAADLAQVCSDDATTRLANNSDNSHGGSKKSNCINAGVTAPASPDSSVAKLGNNKTYLCDADERSTCSENEDDIASNTTRDESETRSSTSSSALASTTSRGTSTTSRGRLNFEKLGHGLPASQINRLSLSGYYRDKTSNIYSTNGTPVDSETKLQEYLSESCGEEAAKDGRKNGTKFVANKDCVETTSTSRTVSKARMYTKVLKRNTYKKVLSLRKLQKGDQIHNSLGVDKDDSLNESTACTSCCGKSSSGRLCSSLSDEDSDY